MSESLEDCRKKIDDIDREVVRLLDERARTTVEIGRLKNRDGSPIRCLGREAQVYRNVVAASEGPLGERALRSIYREIISTASELQRATRVAYLGPPATFSHEAARHQFGSSVEFIPARSIREVFQIAEKGEADFGVVPIENSTDGAVTHTLDTLADSDLKICGEVSLPISHHLLSSGTRESILRVYSHPQALAQTRDWLSQNFPGVEVFETSSTARAAEMVAGDPSAAAVATELAAEEYGVNVLARRIEDNPHNYTRFLVVGREMSQPTGRDKTSLVFSVRHEVGTLHKALQALARNGINMTKIESRPFRGRVWEYQFFVDIQGHPADDAVSSALRDLSQACSSLRVLGAWPVEG